MRIAFVGKGGSGKTTACVLFARYLNSLNRPVILVDADINQHVGMTLGIDSKILQTIPNIGNNLLEIKSYLSGNNVRITNPKLMQKTTPPGYGSVLLNFSTANPIWNNFLYRITSELPQHKPNTLFGLLNTGEFQSEDIGVNCYHAKTGAVELILNHLVDQPHEYFLVDMTAGADAFASGLFTKFDLTLLLTEATKQSVSVYRQYKNYASDYAINLKVLGNKITCASDLKYLQQELGEDLLATLPISDFVKISERSSPLALDRYEAGLLDAFEKIYQHSNSLVRDWHKLYNQTVEIHLKNAFSWANAISGSDLSTQIDPAVDGSIYMQK